MTLWATFWRLTWGRLPSVCWWTQTRFLLSSKSLAAVQLLRICCGPRRLAALDWPWSPSGFPRGKFTRQMDASGSCLSRHLGFHRRLIRWLTACTVHSSNGRKGTSPVRLTNHFPEVNPPTTLTLERRLTVYVVERRSFELTAVLHHFAEAGTSSRPNRESSPGLVSWLLRYHFLG